MNKCIHFFDLDNTLWELDVKAWLILKNKPNDPLFKLNNIQLQEILNGVYKKQENLIEYDGNTYWISNEMFNKIKKKKKYIELTDVGISFIEYKDPYYYKDITFLIENLRHLIGKEDIDIGIISARYDIDKDNELLKILKNKLKDNGLEINKFYYISNFLKNRNSDTINNNKTKILLEHVTGYHIEDNYFVPIKQNFYEEVHFYDDEVQNINTANDIQYYLDIYLRNTDDEIFTEIKNRINNKKPILYTHLVTNNKLNKYKTTKIYIKEPVSYAIKVDEKLTTKFKDFKNKK